MNFQNVQQYFNENSENSLIMGQPENIQQWDIVQFFVYCLSCSERQPCSVVVSFLAFKTWTLVYFVNHVV